MINKSHIRVFHLKPFIEYLLFPAVLACGKVEKVKFRAFRYIFSLLRKIAVEIKQKRSKKRKRNNESFLKRICPDFIYEHGIYKNYLLNSLSIICWKVLYVSAPSISLPLIKNAGVPETPAALPSLVSSSSLESYFPLDKQLSSFAASTPAFFANSFIFAAFSIS